MATFWAFVLALVSLVILPHCCVNGANTGRNFISSLTPEAADALENRLSLKHTMAAAARAQEEAESVNLTASPACVEAIMATYGASSQPGETARLYMIDSSGGLPSGILGGNTYWLGSYKQCQSLSYAHYCLMSTKWDLQLPPGALPPGFPKELPAKWGLCMPKQCNSIDIYIIATTLSLNGTRFAPVSLGSLPKIDPKSTSVTCMDSPPYDSGTIVAFVIIAIFAFFMIVGTLLDWAWDLLKTSGDMFARSAPAELQLSSSTSSEESEPMGEAGEDPQKDEVRPTAGRRNLLPINHVDGSPYTSSERHGRFYSALQLAQDEGPTSSWISKCMKFFLCFSIVRNGRSILQTSVPDGAIECLNGIRVLSICWVILGHVHLFALGNTANIIDAISTTQRFTFQVVSNAYSAVDSFFMIGGLLVMYLTLKHLDQAHGRFPTFKFYFHRIWRLTPAYMFFLMVWTTLLKHFGDSPLWLTTAKHETDKCESRWWTNLLYINNFYPSDAGTDNQCMGWSWYLAIDMQFYIFAPIIIFITYKSAAGGFGLMSFLLSATFVTTALLFDQHYFYTGTFRAVPTEHPTDGDFSNIIYVKPYCRTVPYIVGLALGYILRKRSHHTLGKMLRTSLPPTLLKILRVTAITAGWCIASTFMMVTVYGLYGVVSDNRYLSHNDGIAYATFARFSWSLGLAWVVFACHFGLGSYVNSLLSLRFWIPLSRLSYSAYLVHPLPVAMLIIGQDQALIYQDTIMAFYYLAAVMASFLGASILYLAVEGPFMELEKLFFRRKRTM